MSAIAYIILERAIIKTHGEASVLRQALGSNIKGNASPVLYSFGIASAFISPWIAGTIYVSVAIMWLIPDRRIERALVDK